MKIIATIITAVMLFGGAALKVASAEPQKDVQLMVDSLQETLGEEKTVYISNMERVGYECQTVGIEVGCVAVSDDSAVLVIAQFTSEKKLFNINLFVAKDSPGCASLAKHFEGKEPSYYDEKTNLKIFNLSDKRAVLYSDDVEKENVVCSIGALGLDV